LNLRAAESAILTSTRTITPAGLWRRHRSLFARKMAACSASIASRKDWPPPREPAQTYHDQRTDKIFEAALEGVGKIISLAATCFVGFLLVSSNPTKADFTAFLKVEVEKYLTSKANSTNNEFARRLLEGSAGYSSEIVDYGLDIKRRDMILFSIYRARLNDFVSQLAGGYNPINECVIGVAGTFLPCPFQEE
jgi:hypothetical protein